MSLGLALAGAAFSAPAASAQDDFLASLNKRALEVRDDRRADKILLAPLAKMQAPPAEVLADLEAGPAWALIDSSVAARFAKMKAWSDAAPQQEVLKALAEATKQFDRNDPGMGWGMAYGQVGEAAEAVRLDLNVDLGSDEPTIAEANPKYLKRLQWLEMLANVDASKLAGEGKPSEAINRLIDLFYLGREIADRDLSVEVQVGFSIMVRSLSRIRDVAYQDFRGERKLELAALRSLIQRLGDEPLKIARIRFPMGDKYGIEQLIARAYGEGTKADGEKVGPMLARIATREHPLRIFNESARWAEAAKSMSDKAQMVNRLGEVYGDWTNRWAVDAFDPRMRATFEYSKLNKTRFPIIGLLPDLTSFFDQRMVLNTEIVGTRSALGLLGYYYQNRAFPRTIVSARPEWLSTKEGDPFNPEERSREGVPPLKYKRPVVDDDKKAEHLMTVVTGSGYNFRLSLGEAVWMIWSVGSNNVNDGAKFVQNTATRVTNADYIIWPPMESLTRQHLKDIDALK